MASRLLERIPIQFQELDNGSTPFKLTAAFVLSLFLIFVAHRIRDKQQKATASEFVPTANRSSDMLSSTTTKAVPPAGSVTVSKILIHPIKVSVIASISRCKTTQMASVVIKLFLIRAAEPYLCKVLTTLQRVLRCVQRYRKLDCEAE